VKCRSLLTFIRNLHEIHVLVYIKYFFILWKSWGHNPLQNWLTNFTTVWTFRRSALHSSGDYVLAPNQEHYRIPEQIWRCKSTEDKHNVFKWFLCSTLFVSKSIVSSALTIPSVPNSNSIISALYIIKILIIRFS
jgi:hypothetical protein